ncbi:hypothetical protein [Mucilaginibacter sp. SG564]|uniref:hypothetical protein n=1 Tax=unclassified Mucilaginibacter TaxID=2617802 RepID=UPI001552D5C7|nr:hypothetical protein [Mucilaginibacter sp. SG564]NOW95139.1 hypothetical protein [Mucilaginibacter sp. SG564]
MKQRKYLERRTFNQDRFDILIKRQKRGVATFNELTELDAIVNRDPDIRESILEEMQAVNNPPDEPEQKEILQFPPVKTQTWLDKVAAFFKRLFTTMDDASPALLS